MHDNPMKVNVDTFEAWSDAHYPRPDLCRESWLNLGGQWEFATDPTDEGLTLGWHLPGAHFSHTICVPFPPGSPSSQWSGERSDVVWYRRRVTPEEIRDAGLADAGHRPHLLIHFEAVDFASDVWVNGLHLVHHEGGYTPFTVEIDPSDYLDAGFEIVVRAHDRLDAVDQPRGKQDWQEHPHGIWYHCVVGIWRDVWMEVVPANYVRSLTWSWDIEEAQVTCDVECAGLPAATGSRNAIEACLTLDLAGVTLAATMVRAHSGQLRLVAQIPALANRQEWGRLLWSPAHPNLINARICVGEDEVVSYVGIRDVNLSHRYLEINHQPTYLRGILDQGYWPSSYFTAPSAEALKEDLELARDMGFNFVRIHERSADRRTLTWADRMGMMVWGESASAYAFSDRAVSVTTQEWHDLVLRDRNHPSVIVWVPFNESWGVDLIVTSPRQQAFVRSVVALTDALDGTRPVIANDGWEQLETPIVTTHDYGVYGEQLRVNYADRESIAELVNGVGPQGRKILLGQPWSDDRPVMVTEFGGISLPLDAEDAWGYAVVPNAQAYEERVTGLFEALEASPILAGFCYTQLTDTRQETNGLADENRTPKLPLDVIRGFVTSSAQQSGQIRPRTIVEASAVVGTDERSVVSTAFEGDHNA